MTKKLRPVPRGLSLAHGAHSSPEDGMCVMEAVAFVAGEKFSDHPDCASKVIGEFLRSWNDAMSDQDRQQLKPLIRKLVGSNGTPAVELKRSWMALDWYVRVSTPAWLRLAGLNEEADAIAKCAPITDTKSAAAARKSLDIARAKAAAARDAAGAAAWDAAWAAARAAAGAAARDAARDAARAAAWDAAGAAARDAAWAAAWDAAGAAARAAARDAAGAAAWAALRPTVVHLQREAIKLVLAMLAVTE